MASAGGGVRATDEIPDVEMDIVEWPAEEPERVGAKRARDSPNAKGYYGFFGVTTAEKKLTTGSQTLPDSNALRFSSSSSGEDLENKIKRPTKMCPFYLQGRCMKGNSCTFLHEWEGSGSDNRWSNGKKACLLTQVGYVDSIGSKGGSQLPHLSNLEAPQFKNSEGSSKDVLYRSLIHAYGEDNKRLTHLVDKQNSPARGVSQGMFGIIDELVQVPVVHERNCEPVDVKGTFPRLHLDGGKLQQGNSLSYSHVSRTYLETSPFSSDNRYRSFDPSISHLKMLPSRQFTPGIERDGLLYDNVDKDCGTSRPVLLASSSPQVSIMSVESLSPIKDEVWETSVPFVPSFSFPHSTTPTGSQYDPFVDSIDPPKVESTNNLRSANMSSSALIRHTSQKVITEKFLSSDDKLARNMSAKVSNEHACLIASDKGHSSSLDGNDRVKACGRKHDASSNSEKTKEFRFRLAEHVKELVKPIWKEGYLSKDAHKLVVKKSVDKVLDSIEPHQVPTTEELITNYLTACGSKIEKLVKAYVDRHRKA
ncbi:hypothetical protein ACP70R_034133 [Stipagrostis hirtigluma subsp. patula]